MYLVNMNFEKALSGDMPEKLETSFSKEHLLQTIQRLISNQVSRAARHGLPKFSIEAGMDQHQDTVVVR